MSPYVCVNSCLCTRVCMCACGGQKSTQLTFCLIFWDSFSLNLEFLDWLASPRVLLPLPPLCWGYIDCIHVLLPLCWDYMHVLTLLRWDYKRVLHSQLFLWWRGLTPVLKLACQTPHQLRSPQPLKPTGLIGSVSDQTRRSPLRSMSHLLLLKHLAKCNSKEVNGSSGLDRDREASAWWWDPSCSCCFVLFLSLS